MGMKSIYIRESDQHVWDELDSVAKRRRQSASALLSEIIEDWHRRTSATSSAMALPAGFQAPSSMLDPEALEQEELAADIKDAVLKILRSREKVAP